MDAAKAGEMHDFGGELALSFQDGQTIFVSWVGEPVQYAIGTKDSSHFVAEAQLTDFDVSGSAMWADLIGRDIALQHVASDNQVLEVSSEAGHIFLCSFEHGGWWADEVTVCKRVPASYDA